MREPPVPVSQQVALALARILDNPKAMNQHPAAAKVLATMLDKLHSASARGHRGHLAVVKSMTASSPLPNLRHAQETRRGGRLRRC